MSDGTASRGASRRLRILILSQWFDPEPAIKGLPFARELVARGHEVRVLTGFPNYPGGRLYPGYRIRPVARETVDGIHITRVALYPSHSRSAIGRVANYLSFAASATIAGLAMRFRPDVLYVYHPPLTVGIAAAVIGRIRRIPFVYDVQDLWPDTLSATGMIGSGRVLGLVGTVASWVYRHASVVVPQSEGFMRRLGARGVPADRMKLVYNWCDEAALGTTGQATLDGAAFAGRFNVVFAGNMGPAQGLDAVLDAATLLERTHPQAQFLFVGGGTSVDALKRRVSEESLSNVTFLPRVPMNQVGEVLARADALLVHLRDDPLFTITLPSKTQAYLFAARPIVMAVGGEAADLVGKAGAGVSVPPEDPAALASAIGGLIDAGAPARERMGRSGREFYDAHLSLAIGTAKMEEAFMQAVDGVR